MSIDGLKFRGSTITCPISAMWLGAIFFHSSAFGSSGIASDTAVTVTSVAYFTVPGPSERT